MTKNQRSTSRVLVTIKTIEGKRRSSSQAAGVYAREREALIPSTSRVGTTRSGSQATA